MKPKANKLPFSEFLEDQLYAALKEDDEE